ncbi:MAG: hypothetical protein M0Z45_11205 [Actinomycetota bacterium]|nr:hypothetical protein [Actinomycetota bacterium]
METQELATLEKWKREPSFSRFTFTSSGSNQWASSRLSKSSPLRQDYRASNKTSNIDGIDQISDLVTHGITCHGVTSVVASIFGDIGAETYRANGRSPDSFSDIEFIGRVPLGRSLL